jgi:hypothetical protein
VKDISQFTEKQQLLIEHLFSPECGGDFRKAMHAAGYSKGASKAHLLTPDLREYLLAASENYLAMSSGKAAMKLVGVLDNPSEIGNDRVLQAAKEVLDRVGITKVEKHQHEVTTDAIIILPAKDITPKQKAIDGTAEVSLDKTQDV